MLVVGLLAIARLGGPDQGRDRPARGPPGGLVETSGSAFPSEHAAYSTFYTWLAVTVAFRIDPGITRRTLLIGAGIAPTALIGLSRVYLTCTGSATSPRGWALGVSSFALVGAAALVVRPLATNLRQR